MKQAVMRCDKYTGEGVIELRHAPRPMGIVAVSNLSLSCKLSMLSCLSTLNEETDNEVNSGTIPGLSNKCKQSNGGCEDICRLDAAGKVVCSCHSGRRLLEDGTRCTNSMTLNCSSEEFTCSSLSCIPYTETCDGIRQCFDGSDEDPHYCGTYIPYRRVSRSFHKLRRLN